MDGDGTTMAGLTLNITMAEEMTGLVVTGLVVTSSGTGGS